MVHRARIGKFCCSSSGSNVVLNHHGYRGFGKFVRSSNKSTCGLHQEHAITFLANQSWNDCRCEVRILKVFYQTSHAQSPKNIQNNAQNKIQNDVQNTQNNIQHTNEEDALNKLNQGNSAITTEAESIQQQHQTNNSKSTHIQNVTNDTERQQSKPITEDTKEHDTIFKNHILIYTAPPYPNYKNVVMWNTVKLGISMTISMVGTLSTFFLGASPITYAMALAPLYNIFTSVRKLRHSLKEIKRIYYVKENDRELLRLLLYRVGEDGKEMVDTLDITEKKSLVHFPNIKNHSLDPYPMEWAFGKTDYRLDSHGVLHIHNLDFVRKLILPEETWVSVFNVKRRNMDKYGFVRIAPDKELGGQVTWSKKWHVIVDDEIHILLFKPFERYYAIDAFCHKHHPMAEGKLSTKVDFNNKQLRSPENKTSLSKSRFIACSSCPKPRTYIDLQAASLPVRIIDGWVCIRVDSVHRDINGGRSSFAHCLRDNMTLEEFLSFYSIYK